MASNADYIVGGFQGLGNALAGASIKAMDNPANQRISPYQKHIADMLAGKLHPRDAATLAKAEKLGLLRPGEVGGNEAPPPTAQMGQPMPGLGGQAVSAAPNIGAGQGLGSYSGPTNRVPKPYEESPMLSEESEGPAPETQEDFNRLLQTASLMGKEKDPTVDLLKILASNQRADASNQTRRGIAEGQLHLGQERLDETKSRNRDLHDEALARLKLGREKFDYAQEVGGDPAKSAVKYIGDLMNTKAKLLGDQAKQTSSFAAGTPEAQEFTNRTNAIIQELDREIQSTRAIVKPALGKGPMRATTRASGSSGGGQAGQNDAVYIVSPSGDKATISRKQAAAALAQNPGSTIQEIPKK